MQGVGGGFRTVIGIGVIFDRIPLFISPSGCHHLNTPSIIFIDIKLKLHINSTMVIIQINTLHPNNPPSLVSPFSSTTPSNQNHHHATKTPPVLAPTILPANPKSALSYKTQLPAYCE